MTEREKRLKAIDEVVKTLEEMDSKEQRKEEMGEGKKMMMDAYSPSGYATSMSAVYISTASGYGAVPIPANTNAYYTYNVPKPISKINPSRIVPLNTHPVFTTGPQKGNIASTFGSFILKLKVWK